MVTRVLFVDAGNYCRSPAAEFVARQMAERIGKDSQLTFASAGLKDKHAGDSADPRTVAACGARGYDLAGFRCREITPNDFHSANLILAMDRENLAALQQRTPAGCTAEFALFLGDAEVSDPYFGAADGFTLMMDQIEAGAERLIARL